MAEKDDLWAETGDDPVPEEWRQATGTASWTDSIGHALASHLGRLEESGWLRELERMSVENGDEKSSKTKEVRMLAGLAGLKGQDVTNRLMLDEFDFNSRPAEDRWLLELPPEEDG